MKTTRFDTGAVQIHAMAAGPPDGPVVVLLHGFPEFWYGWQKQIEPLAAAGFRVIVPDQRGYNLSSKPRGIGSYSVAKLVGDLIALADRLGQPKIFLAGHDWGAAVAWSAALLYPERIAKLAVLNVPHPAVMRRFLLSRPSQLFRSWYLFFFQLPWLPELFLSAFRFRLATRSLVNSSRKGTFSRQELERYRAAWSETGSLTAMIHWYRAAFRFPARFENLVVTVPTRIIWGQRDRFLDPAMARESLSYCSRGELFELAEATHWVQHEEPERVAELLKEFFLG